MKKAKKSIKPAGESARRGGKMRAAIALTAAAAVLMFCFVTAAAALSNSKYIYTAAARLIPETYTEPDSGITFYREDAADVSAESEAELTAAYSYYYIDSSGEKVYLTDGVYRYTSSSGQQVNVGVSMGFVLLAVAKIKKIISAFKIIIAVLSIVLAAGAAVIISAAVKQKKPQKSRRN